MHDPVNIGEYLKMSTKFNSRGVMEVVDWGESDWTVVLVGWSGPIGSNNSGTGAGLAPYGTRESYGAAPRPSVDVRCSRVGADWWTVRSSRH